MIFIGVTGGIGSGKSLVCSLFEKKNVPIFHADDIAKEILTKAEISAEIENAFGKQVLDPSGKLDKRRLADAVFSDSKKLQVLNSIIHPKVFVELDGWKRKQLHGIRYGLAEAALIFESGMDEKLDYVLAVTADEMTRIQRVMARDHTTEQEVKARMRHQLPEEELVKKSDFVLQNNSTVKNLELQINFFHTLFSTLTERKPLE